MTARTISFADALACTTLLGECIELSDDPAAWQKHLADGTDRLIGGVASALKVLQPLAGEPVVLEGMLSGSDAEMHQSFDACRREGGHKQMPALDRLMGAVEREGELAFRYSDLTGGLHRFHASDFYDRYFRQLRIGDGAAGFHAQPTGRLVCVMVLRQRNDRSFGSRQQDVLAFLSAALARLVGTRLETQRILRAALPPRMESTLQALLEGDSEKQVAARLGLRQSTVHGYVRELYRRYGVRSRGELLARFIKRRKSATAS